MVSVIPIPGAREAGSLRQGSDLQLDVEAELSRLKRASAQVYTLPAEDIPRLLSLLGEAQASLAAAQIALAERLAASSPSQSRAATFPETTDRWLTTDETADLLKVDRKWLYRRAKGLPFCRRLSRKKLLFSEAGLERWMANRKP